MIYYTSNYSSDINVDINIKNYLFWKNNSDKYIEEKIEDNIVYNIINLDDKYYTFSKIDNKKEIVENILEYFLQTFKDNFNDIYERLGNMLEIDSLEDENITPQYDSFLGFINFLQLNNTLPLTSFSLLLNENGEFVIETKYTDKYLKAKFIDSNMVFYNILNSKKSIDIILKNTIEKFNMELIDYYV